MMTTKKELQKVIEDKSYMKERKGKKLQKGLLNASKRKNN